MTAIDPRMAIARRAAEGARAARQALADATKPRLRTGRRTRQAIDALLRLRVDIGAGLPHAALLERIDDELYKLKR